MADFNRIIVPNGSTWLSTPGGLTSWGQSGKGQFRSTTQVGRIWEETYPPMKWNDQNLRKFIAYINYLWSYLVIFEITPWHLQSTITTITGTMSVNGGNQTGYALNTTGWTGTLHAGEIIKLPGINHIFDIIPDTGTPTNTSYTNTGGAKTIYIAPQLVSGASPTDTGTIITTNVELRAVLHEPPVMPKSPVTEFYDGLTLKFRECP